MKQIITFLFLVFACQLAVAQQSPQYSIYMFNKYGFNPGYAGLDNSVSLTGVYRQQWDGLPEGPKQQSVNVHTPFYFAGGGLGLSFENETLGAQGQSRFALTYSYHLPMGDGILSLGTSGGYVQRSLDGSKIRTPDGSYDELIFQHNDQTLPINKITGGGMTFDFGAYYKGEKLEAGISALNLSEQQIDLDGNIAFQLNRSYYLNLGYSLDISRKVVLLPSILVKTTFSQTQIDFSALFRYNDNIFLGGSFRGYNSETIDAVAIIGGFKLNEKITIAYAYDLTLSELSTVSNGSHEIMLNYNLGKVFGKGKPPHIIYNPRNL